MSRYGLQPGIGTDPIQIPARKLEPPSITFGGGKSEPTVRSGHGKRRETNACQLEQWPMEHERQEILSSWLHFGVGGD